MLAPGGSDQVHSTLKLSTLFLEISLNGLWPRFECVRRQINQSSSGGFSSMSLVTGVRSSRRLIGRTGPFVAKLGKRGANR